MAQLMSAMTFTATAPLSDTPQRSTKVNGLWKVIGYLAALVVVLALGESIVAATANLKIPSRERVFTNNVSALNVNTANGSVTIVRSPRSATIVESSGSRGLVSPTDSERVHNGRLSVQSICPSSFFDNNCSRNYIIHVPATAAVTVDTGQGEIVESGISGAVTLNTDQGDMVISGHPLSLRVTTGQGSVNAKDVSSKSVYVNTDQGDVTLNFTSPPSVVTALSGQGDIDVIVPRGPDLYHVSTATDQGTSVIDVPSDTESHRLIKASTLQGNIFVRYDNHVGQ
jgi:hypothetical protein